jgi:hypothetical protein
MTSNEIEFGLDTSVFVTVDESGHPLIGDVVIRDPIEEAVVADAAAIDSFNIGEHSRPDLMDSAGHVMLAAIAGGGHIASLLGFGPDQLTSPAVTAAPVIGMPTTALSSTSPPPSPAAS